MLKKYLLPAMVIISKIFVVNFTFIWCFFVAKMWELVFCSFGPVFTDMSTLGADYQTFFQFSQLCGWHKSCNKRETVIIMGV